MSELVSPETHGHEGKHRPIRSKFVHHFTCLGHFFTLEHVDEHGLSKTKQGCENAKARSREAGYSA